MHLFSLFATTADNEWIHVCLLSSSQLSHFIEVDSLNILEKKGGYHCLEKRLEVEVTRVVLLSCKQENLIKQQAD